LTTDGIVAARDPHFFPEQALDPHRPSMALLFEADLPDHVEGVDDEHVDAKVAALLAHQSQLRSTMGVEDAANLTQIASFEAHILKSLAAHGALADTRYGEAFKAIRDL
jgi:hypothetical protein